MSEKQNALYYAKKMCDTMMHKFPNGKLHQSAYFNYHAGVFLSGMERVYFQTGERKYFDYIKAWAEDKMDADGNLIEYNPENLDDIQPSNTFFNLYRETGDERYKKVLDTLVSALKSWRKNPEGGFWHKAIRVDQMWLDGLYMAGPVATRYASEFSHPEYFGIMLEQALLMYEHMYDEKTGLLYHAWDSSKQQEWCQPESGCAPEFWGRAMGWYFVAICDMLDYITDEEIRKPFLTILKQQLENIVRYQNPENGFWYQIVDKGHLEDNWCETSCTCLYTYALAKAVGKGYIGKEYLEYAKKAYDGLIKSLQYDETDDILLEGTCIGTSVSDYQYYIERPRATNDLHGVGAFVLMCTQMAQAGF